MELADISCHIEQAKADNRRWLTYAEAMVRGDRITKEGIPSYKDECIPCQWLYDHSDEVSRFYKQIDKVEVELFHFDIMEQIEILRYDLHDNYLQIFKTYLPQLNNSVFAFIFRTMSSQTGDALLEAKENVLAMQQIVDELDTRLDQLERSLHKMCQLNSA